MNEDLNLRKSISFLYDTGVLRSICRSDGEYRIDLRRLHKTIFAQIHGGHKADADSFYFRYLSDPLKYVLEQGSRKWNLEKGNVILTQKELILDAQAVQTIKQIAEKASLSF